VTAPYVQSKNCMIELRSTVRRQTPLILLVDYSTEHGGLSVDEIETELIGADSRFPAWGFEHELYGSELFAALNSVPPIEWSRLSPFQDVTLRLVAEQLLEATQGVPKSPHRLQFKRRSLVASLQSSGGLRGSTLRLEQDEPSPPSSSPRRSHANSTILDDSVEHERPPLPPPREGRSYHLYCSSLVEGGLALTEELGEFFGSGDMRSGKQRLQVTQDASKMTMCDYMLVYLTAATWQTSPASAAFAREAAHALSSGVALLLAHEMRGLGQDSTHGVEFAEFFESDRGSTPVQLIRAGIYKSVAVPLMGGDLRAVSMVLLARALCAEPGSEPTIVSDTSSLGAQHSFRESTPSRESKSERAPPGVHERSTGGARSRAASVRKVPHMLRSVGLAVAWSRRRARPLLRTPNPEGVETISNAPPQPGECSRTLVVCETGEASGKRRKDKRQIVAITHI